LSEVYRDFRIGLIRGLGGSAAINYKAQRDNIQPEMTKLRNTLQKKTDTRPLRSTRPIHSQSHLVPRRRAALAQSNYDSANHAVGYAASLCRRQARPAAVQHAPVRRRLPSSVLADIANRMNDAIKLREIRQSDGTSDA